MSEPVQDGDSLAVDLTGIPLDQIARLCAATANDLSPEDATDRPALRRALRRVRETAGQEGEAFAGHGEQPPPLLPLSPLAEQ
jgi:FXSXX-COOH protein